MTRADSTFEALRQGRWKVKIHRTTGTDTAPRPCAVTNEGARLRAGLLRILRAGQALALIVIHTRGETAVRPKAQPL